MELGTLRRISNISRFYSVRGRCYQRGNKPTVIEVSDESRNHFKMRTRMSIKIPPLDSVVETPQLHTRSCRSVKTLVSCLLKCEAESGLQNSKVRTSAKKVWKLVPAGIPRGGVGISAGGPSQEHCQSAVQRDSSDLAGRLFTRATRWVTRSLG